MRCRQRGKVPTRLVERHGCGIFHESTARNPDKMWIYSMQVFQIHFPRSQGHPCLPQNISCYRTGTYTNLLSSTSIFQTNYHPHFPGQIFDKDKSLHVRTRCHYKHESPISRYHDHFWKPITTLLLFQVQRVRSCTDTDVRHRCDVVLHLKYQRYPSVVTFFHTVKDRYPELNE